jgi:hypothetical protein
MQTGDGIFLVIRTDMTIIIALALVDPVCPVRVGSERLILVGRTE